MKLFPYKVHYRDLNPLEEEMILNNIKSRVKKLKRKYAPKTVDDIEKILYEEYNISTIDPRTRKIDDYYKRSKFFKTVKELMLNNVTNELAILLNYIKGNTNDENILLVLVLMYVINGVKNDKVLYPYINTVDEIVILKPPKEIEYDRRTLIKVANKANIEKGRNIGYDYKHLAKKINTTHAIVSVYFRDAINEIPLRKYGKTLDEITIDLLRNCRGSKELRKAMKLVDELATIL